MKKVGRRALRPGPAPSCPWLGTRPGAEGLSPPPLAINARFLAGGKPQPYTRRASHLQPTNGPICGALATNKWRVGRPGRAVYSRTIPAVKPGALAISFRAFSTSRTLRASSATLVAMESGISTTPFSSAWIRSPG